MQAAVTDIQGKLREQLTAQEMTAADFGFGSHTRNEVHVKFSPQKSQAELATIIEEMHLYGSLPLSLKDGVYEGTFFTPLGVTLWVPR